MTGPALIAGEAAKSRTGRRIALALCILFAALLATPLLMFAGGGGGSAAPAFDSRPRDPYRYIAAYWHAAVAEHIDWAILAAIGKVECNHGRTKLAGCSPIGSVNSAGASGPMQFLPGTWRAGATPGASPPPGAPTTTDAEGYASDGDGDGIADIWNIDDATLAAARLLRANGAPVDYRRALYAYNHSDAYVARVLQIADDYRGGSVVTRDPGSPGSWALLYRDTPYVWGGNHLNPEQQLGRAQPTVQIGGDGRAGFFDCSSLVSWAYAKARGVWVGGTTGEQWQMGGQAPAAARGYGSPPGGWRAGDLGFYDALGHVVLALSPTTYIEAPQTGADVRIGHFSERAQAYGYVRYPQPLPQETGN